MIGSNAELQSIIESCIERVLDRKLDSFLKKVEENTRKIREVEQIIDSQSTKMKDLQTKIDFLQNACNRMVKENNDLEQYSRRNCLRIFGIPETENESTDDEVIKFAKSRLDVQIDPSEIDRSHRIGKPGSPSPRHIIVKFLSYSVRQRVIKNRRRLKGTGIVVKEDLTKYNQSLLQEAKKLAKVKSAWSHDGKILALVDVNGIERKQKISDLSDLERLS